MASTYYNGLYINGQKIDIENEELFLFKYSNNDVIDPQAIKNSYSKTISIKGTPNNNTVFNNLWKLDYTLHTYGNQFNPMQRNPFELYNNGNIIEAGYVQLNTIKYVKNDPVYEITLFGMLGDFFYKLMYKDEESETEMSLADLQYDFYKLQRGTILGVADIDEENKYYPTQNPDELCEFVDDTKQTSPILVWNKNYIWNSWLLNFTKTYENVEHNLWEQFLTAIPVYNGYHDDFDNDHVLVNMSDYPSSYTTGTDSLLPSTFDKDGNHYIQKYGYSLIETQRDMDEWEIRDLRSTFQRPGIKFGKLMQIITDYSNKNGYNISWDPDIDITNTKNQNFTVLNDYFWRSYILLDTLEFSEQRTDETSLPEIINIWNSIDATAEIYLKNPINQTTVFDLTSYSNPTVELNIIEDFWPFYFQDPTGISEAMQRINSGNIGQGTSWSYTYRKNSVFGAWVYKVDVYQNGTLLPTYSKIIYVYNQNGADWDDSIVMNALKTKLQTITSEDYGLSDYVLYNVKTKNGQWPSDDFHFMFFEEGIKIQIYNLPAQNNIQIKLTKDYFNLYADWNPKGAFIPTDITVLWKKGNEIKTGSSDTMLPYQPINTQGNRFIMCGLDQNDFVMFGWNSNYSDSLIDSIAADFKNQYTIQGVIYSGEETTTKNLNISKRDLLGNTSSPFKYLVDWCKLFNLRFRTDLLTKTIFIEQRKNYFINEIIDINDDIDYGKDFIIDPVYVENNIYKFTLETDETDENYAKYIYNKTFSADYSTKNIITNYSFNNEPLDVFSDNIYNTNIDYLMSSPYYNTTKIKTDATIIYPTMCLFPKYEYYLWEQRIDNAIVSNNKTQFGLQSYKTVPKIDDSFTKQCLFDKDYNSLDSTNSLVLFDGIYTIPQQSTRYQPYILSDDVEIMNTLNEDNPCFLNGYYDNSIIPYTTSSYWINRPLTGIINKTNQTGNIGLWTFFIPILHCSSREKTGDLTFDKTYYFSTPNTTTDAYYGKTTWASQSSMYDKWWGAYESDVLDNDAKTVECYVFLNEQPQKALRKFYYFKNTVWSLLDINDYNFKNKDFTPTKCKFIKVEDINNYMLGNTTPEPEPGPEPPQTDQDLYQCQWIIGQWGGDTFTQQDLEDAIDMYYADWRDYQPNVDLFNDIVAHIEEGYITGVHTIEKSMFDGMITVGIDFDSYGYYSIETYGEIIVIPHN